MLGLRELIALNADWGRGNLSHTPPAPHPGDYIIEVTDQHGSVSYRGPGGRHSIFRTEVRGWPLLLDAVLAMADLRIFLHPDCVLKVQQRGGNG